MQRRFYTKRALASIGQNHHAAPVQNAQQPSACFLLRFPKRHRELLPQDTLYHLVKVRIHGVDFSAAALLLGLLLPQLLEQGKVLVKIIGVEQRLIMFCQRCLYPRRDVQFLLFDVCKVGCRLLRRDHRAQGIFFCSRNIAAIVGIRKIRPEGVVLSGGLLAKPPQPDPFHLMHSQISVDYQRSRLKP